ncbi:MAG: lipid kinase [Vulcanimicrobiaceae bacterium]
MQASVVINERSSRSGRAIAALPQLLASRGIDLVDFVVASDEEMVRKRLERCVDGGATLAIVGGGDGAMTVAAGVLAHRKCALGVLPLGTGNSFALTLGISDDLPTAIDVIAAHRVARVDLGTVNGTYFANFATIGLSAEIADRAPHALKAIVGTAAYAVGGIGSFFTHRPFRTKIRSETGERELRTQQIVITSGRFFGHQPVAPDASIVDGLLDLFTTSGVSRFDVARMYVAFGLGLQNRLPDALTLTAKEIAVKTTPKQLVSIDGRTLGKTPARFGIAPRALRVCVPAGFDDARG